MSFKLKEGLDKILEGRNDLSDYVSKVTFDEDKIPIVREELSPDQQKVFDHLIDFIKNDGNHQFYSLTGYAGTGKTYLLSRLVSCITSKVALTAPTNKAVKVLQDSGKLSVGKTTCSTIHKLLALRVVWKPPSKKGGMPRQILTRNTWSDPTINEYSLVIIDESSMINWEIFSLLYQELGTNLKVIFSGDPAQIPPVNESDSIPLDPSKQEKYGFATGHLNRIMRQAEGNSILAVASAIRDNRFLNEDLIRKHRKLLTAQVEYYPITKQTQFRDELLEYFDSDKFKADPNYCKVIAWTNRTVDYYNEIIRMRLFKTANLAKVMKGEQMIADSPIFNDEEEIVFNTSDEFEIVDYEMRQFGYSLPGELEQGELKFAGEESGKFQLSYYRCQVKYFISAEAKKNGDASYRRVDILHEKDTEMLKKIIKNLAQIGKQSGNWKHYYAIQERFAGVKYNYAITAHKSQGSTYQHVFLIEDDIDENPRYIERNRIKYTAVTRPAESLKILSRRNHESLSQRRS